jgi:hypothetical protein
VNWTLIGQTGLFLFLALIAFLVWATVLAWKSFQAPVGAQRLEWLGKALEIAERAEALIAQAEPGEQQGYTPAKVKRLAAHMRAYLTEHKIRLTITPELVILLLAERSSSYANA